MAFAQKLWGADTIGFDEKFLSVNEVMEQSGMDYHVESQPLYLANGDLLPKHRATVRTDTGDVFGVVSPKYVILENKDAFSFFQPFVDTKSAYIESIGTLKKGAITFIQAKITSNPIEITKGDSVDAHITLLNSFAGNTNVVVSLYPKRLVCCNQLPALKSSSMLRVKHTKNCTIALDRIQQILDVSSREFIATADTYRFLASKGCKAADLKKYITLVLKDDKEGNEEKEVRETRIEKIETLFESGRGATEHTRNYWGAFNAVQEYLQYEAGRSVDTRLASLWMGQNAQLNQKALSVAVKLSNEK